MLIRRRAFAELAEVELQGTVVIQRPQGADPVADARGQNAELGPRDRMTPGLQLRGRLEANGDAMHVLGRRIQAHT